MIEWLAVGSGGRDSENKEQEGEGFDHGKGSKVNYRSILSKIAIRLKMDHTENHNKTYTISLDKGEPFLTSSTKRPYRG